MYSKWHKYTRPAQWGLKAAPWCKGMLAARYAQGVPMLGNRRSKGTPCRQEHSETSACRKP